LKEAALALGFVSAEQFEQWIVPLEMTQPNAHG
jgi:fumarate hydratase class II